MQQPQGKTTEREHKRPAHPALLRPAVIPWILLAVPLLLYANTLAGDYVLDDGIVITQNRFTQQGLAGIRDIFTKDSFAGSSVPGDMVGGGRYRPLSIATFALEWELFGRNPLVSHLINILCYSVTILLIYRLCRRYLFPQNTIVSFIAALLFAIHPIHTEAVANIKGRDELLVFLFLLLLLVALFRSLQGSRVNYATSLVFFALSLFSKETATTYVAIVPATLWWFARVDVKRIARLTAPYLALAVLFLLLRFMIIGFPGSNRQEILNNPYLFASTEARYATTTFVLGKYLALLFWPAVMSHDYGFNQIPLRALADPAVWLSAAVYLAMIGLAATGVRHRRPETFGCLFFLVTISISSNIFINVGAPMADRLLYVPSFGFALVGAFLLGHLYRGDRFRGLQWCATALVLAILALGGARTVARNAEWKNDESLYLADVRNAPNSARTHKAAGGVLIKKAADESSPRERRRLLEQSIQHLNRAIEIYPNYVDAHVDLGMAYRLNGQSEKAEVVWSRLEEIRPGHPVLPTLGRLLGDSFRAEGLRMIALNRHAEALELLRSALNYIPDSPQVHADMGKVHSDLKEYSSAVDDYGRALQLQPENPGYWYLLGEAHFMQEEWAEAQRCWAKALELEPGNVEAAAGKRAIDSKLAGR